MTRTVRTGIIGCGKIAETHARALRESRLAEFAACCDTDADRAGALADTYDVPLRFTDVHDMLDRAGLEAVLICAPHPAHAQLVVAAADAGVHVLCEKPIAVSLEAADQMIEAADRAGVKFGVIFQRRFWPAARRMREAIDAGRLGRLTLGECSVRIWRSREYFDSDPWRGTWATEGGGVLMNQAVHAIDQFQWFMGNAVEVFGRYATLRHTSYIDVEDTAVATVVFENGALGVIQAASTFETNLGFRIAIHGDSGAAISVWENPEGQQGINDLWNVPGEEHLRSGWERDELGQPGFPGFHFHQIEDFLQAIIDDRPPVVTGKDARRSLEIILAIYRSSQTGQPVSLPMVAITHLKGGHTVG
jgi:predicted dehydrogenase